MHVTHDFSWIPKVILKQKDMARKMQGWNSKSSKFEIKKVYQYAKEAHQNME